MNIFKITCAAALLSGFASTASAITVGPDVTVTGTTGTADFSVDIANLQSVFSSEMGINSGNSQNCVNDCMSAIINGEFYFMGMTTLDSLATNGDGTFSLIYDMQESGNDDTAIINDIIIDVGGTVIFDYNEVTDGDILVDGSDSPLGNGADFIVTLNQNLLAGFSGDTKLSLFWQDQDGSNGADEWTSEGSNRFVPTTPVPLPAGLPLLMTCIAAFGFTRRRKG